MAEAKQKKDWLVPVMVLAIIGGAFFVGRLSAQVEFLSSGGTAKGTVAGNTAPAAAGGTVAAAPAPSNLSLDSLKAMAKELKLNEDKFNSCLDDGKFAQKVKDDQAYGTTLGVSGTPSFFINGVMVVGAQQQNIFEQIIDAELKDGSGDKAYSADGGRKSVATGVGYVRGSKSAKVKIVEFSDFECPFCQRANPTVEAVLAKYGDKVSIEYRHYPLSFHPNAQKAAEASECAGEQGKFWEMHDKMFGA